jgi:hypothetical protein
LDILDYPGQAHYNEPVIPPHNIRPSLRLAPALAVLFVAALLGCVTRPAEQSPDAVTIAYVGAYRGFHRPCG